MDSRWRGWNGGLITLVYNACSHPGETIPDLSSQQRRELYLYPPNTVSCVIKVKVNKTEQIGDLSHGAVTMSRPTWLMVTPQN